MKELRISLCHPCTNSEHLLSIKLKVFANFKMNSAIRGANNSEKAWALTETLSKVNHDQQETYKSLIESLAADINKLSQALTLKKAEVLRLQHSPHLTADLTKNGRGALTRERAIAKAKEELEELTQKSKKLQLEKRELEQVISQDRDLHGREVEGIREEYGIVDDGLEVFEPEVFEREEHDKHSAWWEKLPKVVMDIWRWVSYGGEFGS
jgi:hypothetical protein